MPLYAFSPLSADMFTPQRAAFAAITLIVAVMPCCRYATVAIIRYVTLLLRRALLMSATYHITTTLIQHTLYAADVACDAMPSARV